jgi:hypothetical protein
VVVAAIVLPLKVMMWVLLAIGVLMVAAELVFRRRLLRARPHA